MIHREFDPKKPYRYVCYGRMSTDQQNPRSPDQQFQTVADTLARLHYPWTHVRDYRDDGISGRYMRKRLEFQRLLEEVKNGAIQIDLILVDTLERLGRMEELPGLRRDLFNRHGILVLTADTNFADPTTPQGRVFGMVESIRATEAARIKAHDVHRGKGDGVQHGKWPGGTAPFGFRLKSILTERHGRQEVDHTELEHDPETAWIIRLLFAKADETGWGKRGWQSSSPATRTFPKSSSPLSRRRLATGSTIRFTMARYGGTGIRRTSSTMRE